MLILTLKLAQGRSTCLISVNTLRKYAYSNILKISPPKTDKNSDIFLVPAQNIEYSQSMFLSRNKKMYTPVSPSFTI